MADNVTPFRPRRRASRPPLRFNLQSPRGKALLAQAMAAAAFVAAFFLVGFPQNFVALAFGIAAMAIASSNRYEGMPWARTHHEHVVRTVAIGAALLTLASLVMMFAPSALAGPMFWVRLAVCAWAVLRAVIGFGLALVRRPLPNATGPLI